MKKALLIAARVLLIVAIICTLSFAFYQSSLPPAESNEVSSGVSGALEVIIPSDTPVGEKVHENIREIAHYTEFFTLGFFVSERTMLSSVDCLTSLIVASLFIDIPLFLHKSFILFIYNSE